MKYTGGCKWASGENVLPRSVQTSLKFAVFSHKMKTKHFYKKRVCPEFHSNAQQKRNPMRFGNLE